MTLAVKGYREVLEQFVTVLLLSCYFLQIRPCMIPRLHEPFASHQLAPRHHLYFAANVDPYLVYVFRGLQVQE